MCSRKKGVLGDDIAAFEKWMEEEHASVCDANHSGSSPAMECVGALRIWKRSEENLGLRYTEVISDGDSKTIATLKESEPYGPGVKIDKDECVGHIQKRVGNKIKVIRSTINAINKAPRDVLKVLRADLVELKKTLKAAGTLGRGKKKNVAVKDAEEEIERVKSTIVVGTINEGTQEQLQHYYGNAIRGHSHDLEGMKKACWAVFYHSVSTDEKPQHQCCPTGADSWCKFQRALATHRDAPRHTPTIPASFEPYLKPVFEVLCGEELLEKCLLGATQNQNESFNKLIWARAPKTEYATKATVEVATCLAVAAFNSGGQALVQIMDAFKVPAGPLCTAYLASRDAYRIKRAQARETQVAKKRRQSKRWVEKSAEQSRREGEGLTYEAGGFD